MADAEKSSNKIAADSHEQAVDDGQPISRHEERALLRKLDLNLIPIIMLLYLLSFLDRGSSRLTNHIHSILSCSFRLANILSPFTQSTSATRSSTD
jgi:hypothetical protein